MDFSLVEKFRVDFPKYHSLLGGASSDKIWACFRGRQDITGFFDDISGVWFWTLGNSHVAHILNGPRELTDTFRRLILMAE